MEFVSTWIVRERAFVKPLGLLEVPQQAVLQVACQRKIFFTAYNALYPEGVYNICIGQVLYWERYVQ